MQIQILAIFCCGTFFGAAVYISLVQHPAVLEIDADFGKRFFPPMYNRAAIMQVALALIGFIAGVIAWFNDANLLWLIGAILLISVVPITLLLIKPINDKLLNSTLNLTPQQLQILLSNWGKKHWLRTIVSGLAFILYLLAV